MAIAFFAFQAALGEMNKPASAPLPRAGERQSPGIPSTTHAPVQAPIRTTPGNMPTDLKCPSCGASIKPTARQCAYCGSSITPAVDLPEAFKLGDLEVGQIIRVKHPVQGEFDSPIRGRILYGELWQKVTRPDVPWTLTGSYYAGFVLDQQRYVLNWQERFFLLERSKPLTDQEINRDFLPYARQFGASNQTAQVMFTYDNTRWKIDDIGKFQVEYAEGPGAHLSQGAVGRFIHASSGNKILVVEDFQSGGGGGQDRLWLGYLISEIDIQS